MTDNEIEKLWEELGNIPVNEDDEIEEDFYIWTVGEDKFEIWHWFDEKYSLGVHALLYPNEHKIKK